MGKSGLSGKVVEIVEDDAKPDLEPGYDYRPATSQTKVGDNLGRSQDQGTSPAPTPATGPGPGQAQATAEITRLPLSRGQTPPRTSVPALFRPESPISVG